LKPFRTVIAISALLFGAGPATSASRTLGPGQVLAVSEDFILSGSDMLMVNGTADNPCRIDANAQQIRTAPDWSGRIQVKHCEFRSLGTAKKPGFDLVAAGKGNQIVIENSEFIACGAVHLTNRGESGTIFRNNILRASSMVPVTNVLGDSPPGFRAAGRSTAPKLFQGNRIEKSIVMFEDARKWTIGGPNAADSNLFIGIRASLSLFNCEDVLVRGNYIHTEIPSFRWSQVHALAVGGGGRGLVIEHNVIRHGQWVVRGLAGVFRYNLVLDADGHQFIIGPKAGTHIHHNIFARYCTIDPNLNSTIAVIYKGDDIQVYNNTFDGGGKAMKRPWHVPVIEVGKEGFLASLRNNVFFNHPTNFSSGTATVRPGFGEKLASPAPPRLGYADYNLFFNPDARTRQNYGLSVMGKTERIDDGFARHDVPVGGDKNAQAEPRFKGPIPKQFPFNDDDIRKGTVTVAKILGHYREVYSPVDGSPLIGGGDPADGKGAFIGAIGVQGAPHDDFGR